MDHSPPEITTETLAALIAGDLSEVATAELRARITADPDAAARLSELERLAAFLRDEPRVQPSTASLAAAKGLLAASRPGPMERLVGRVADGVRSFLASLDFDSRVSPALAGYRGVADVVQVAFSAEPCQIDLEMHPHEAGGTLLRGQIDADEPAGWSVTIRGRDGQDAAFLHTSSDGSFRAMLPDGSYTMLLERGTVRVEAGPLNIP